MNLVNQPEQVSQYCLVSSLALNANSLLWNMCRESGVNDVIFIFKSIRFSLSSCILLQFIRKKT